MRMPKITECSEPGCDRNACTKGLCQKHYQAMKRAEQKAQAPVTAP